MNQIRLVYFLAITVLLSSVVIACGPSRSRDRGERGERPGVIDEIDAGDRADVDHPSTPDANNPTDPLPTPTCQGCTDDQVCVSGACVDIPDTCPCPSETYCDLSQNRCVVGCIDDADCASGRICNTEQRECRDGCRQDSACGTGRICNDDSLLCQTGCRADSDCGTGQICEELLCRQGCRDNAHCPGDQVCDITQHTCRTSIFAALGTYTTGGNSEWREITTDDGFAAVESGPIPDDGMSWLEIEVDLDAPHVLSFDWTVSCDDSSWHHLTFCRNESCNFIERISGPMFTRDGGALVDITWETVTIEYPAGTHTFAWRYARSWGPRYEDRGWVKNVRLTPTGEDPGTGDGISLTNSDRYDIPDNDLTGVTSPIEVTTTGTVAAVFIDVEIIHSYRGDLSLSLLHDGRTIDVYSSPDSSPNVVLTDHAVSGFEGVSAAGLWQLKIVDSAAEDVGYLSSWTLHIELQ